MAQTTWLTWALASAAFAALTAIFGKVGVQDISSDLATFIRTGVILVVLALILGLTGEFRAPGAITRRSWVFLVLSGLATGGSWLCYYRALKIGQASQVAPVDKLSVVFVAVFAVAFLGERLSLRNWSGIALIALGAVLVAWRGSK